jgi:hypothetical protein
MNNKLKIALAAALIAIIIGTTYAVIKYTSTVTNSVTIKGYGIKLWRLDSDTEVLTINWTQLDLGTLKTSDDALGLPLSSHKLAIKNPGNYIAYIGWQIDPTTPLPTGVTITGQHTNTETEPYQETWGPNVFTFFVPAESVSSWRIRWTLNVGPNATRGTYNFTILLLASDNSSG